MRLGKSRLDMARQVRARQGAARRGVARQVRAGRDESRLGNSRQGIMEFEKSVDTKVLENVLGEAQVGQTITYEAMSQAIGRDVREHSQASLSTARRGVLKTKGFVFGVERNVGLTRLSDAEIVNSSENDRKRVQRAAKRSLVKLTKVRFETLPEEQKRMHVTYSAQLGAIAMFSSKQASNKIESKANSEQMPIGETLKLFG